MFKKLLDIGKTFISGNKQLMDGNTRKVLSTNSFISTNSSFKPHYKRV